MRWLGILLMLPFNGMQTGTSNAVTFSEVVFALRITPAGGGEARSFSRWSWDLSVGLRPRGTRRGRIF